MGILDTFFNKKAKEEKAPMTVSAPKDTPTNDTESYDVGEKVEGYTIKTTVETPEERKERKALKAKRMMARQKTILTQKKGKKSAPKKDRSVKELVNVYDVIVRPRVTEKAALVSEKNVYTFEVHPKASKNAIAMAIKAIYGVDADQIRVAPIAKKAKRIRNAKKQAYGYTKKRKKAYVYLKEGDTIQLA